MKKIALLALVVIPVLVLILTLRPSGNSLNPSKVEFKMPSGGDFTIPTTSGTYNTAEKRGKVLFVFFGFARCPHICPLTLSHLDRMIQSLPTASQDKVEVLFISIDPDRDSVESLAEHLKRFQSPLVAGTDTHENLKKITALFGARYSRIQTGSSFFVDHTSQVFVINSRGEWVESLDYNTPAEEFRQALETADDKKPLAERQILLKDVPLIGENTTCDLATQERCWIENSHGVFKIEMNPRPVAEAQPTTVVVRIESTVWTPLLLDFEGVEQDMGYIRPLLSRNGALYQTTFELPVCELSEMQWRLRLVVQNQHGEKSALQFHMKTQRE